MVWWKSIRSDCRKLWTLPVAQTWVLVQACVLVPLTAVALRWLGFRRWQRILERWSRSSAACAGGKLDAPTIAQLVQAAARRCAGRDSCLTEALVLWWLFRRHDLGGELRIGVRKQAGQLQAHAWVEYRGQALNDAGDGPNGFVPFEAAIVPSGSQAA
jgi:Transglutaminase-like superfamily